MPLVTPNKNRIEIHVKKKTLAFNKLGFLYHSFQKAVYAVFDFFSLILSADLMTASISTLAALLY